MTDLKGNPRPRQGLLFAILALAAGLRLWGLFHHPFVQDELYTLVDARWLLDSPLETGIGARPLYYLLQHALLPVLPETEVGLRILPFLFGLAGIYATWTLARTVFDGKAATVASLLVAIAPWHLYISEMARYWSLVYLLHCVFFLAWIRVGADPSPRLWGWIGLTALVLGSLTHPTFLFPVVGIFLLDAWRVWRERADRSMWSRPTVVRLWLPYASFVVVALLVFFLTGEASTVEQRTSRGLGPMLRLLPGVVQWLTPALPAGAAVAAVALAFSDRDRWSRWGRLAVAGGTSTLVVLTVAASVSEVYTDYAVGVLPLAFVSLGGLVTMLGRAVTRARGIELSVISLMVFAMLPSTASHVSDGTRFDLRPAFEFIRETAPSLPVYTSPIALQNHYAEDLEGRPLADIGPSDLEATVEETDFWVVAPLRRYGLIHDPGGDVRQWLVSHCPEVNSYERPRFDFRMYRVKVFRCGPGRGA